MDTQYKNGEVITTIKIDRFSYDIVKSNDGKVQTYPYTVLLTNGQKVRLTKENYQAIFIKNGISNADLKMFIQGGSLVEIIKKEIEDGKYENKDKIKTKVIDLKNKTTNDSELSKIFLNNNIEINYDSLLKDSYKKFDEVNNDSNKSFDMKGISEVYIGDKSHIKHVDEDGKTRILDNSVSSLKTVNGEFNNAYNELNSLYADVNAKDAFNYLEKSKSEINFEKPKDISPEQKNSLYRRDLSAINGVIDRGDKISVAIPPTQNKSEDKNVFVNNTSDDVLSVVDDMNSTSVVKSKEINLNDGSVEEEKVLREYTNPQNYTGSDISRIFGEGPDSIRVALESGHLTSEQIMVLQQELMKQQAFDKETQSEKGNQYFLMPPKRSYNGAAFVDTLLLILIIISFEITLLLALFTR